MKCLNCGKELDNPRAKYCNDRCRKAFVRREPGQDDKPDTVPPGQNSENVRVDPDKREPGQHPDIPGYGTSECQCFHCQQNRRSRLGLIINHGRPKPSDHLAFNEVNRQTLPGDPDYVGVCSCA